MSDYSRYCIDGKDKVKLSKFDTDGNAKAADKAKIAAKTAENLRKIQELQDRFYADGTQGLVFVLQARDAAGKDSTIKHVMTGLNPQGVSVYSFKGPSSEELKHDFLWRAVTHLPKRGDIAIFNRSYYEDVLVVRVHEMYRNYEMPEKWKKQDPDKLFDERFEDIKNFEAFLTHNGYKIIKVFLNVSKDEQKKRQLERIDRPEKNWKFNAGDLDERALWDEYDKAYEDCMEKTATEQNPWYVIPADKKWYTRYLISQLLCDTLEEMDPQYPQLSEQETASLADSRKKLMAERSEKPESEKPESEQPQVKAVKPVKTEKKAKAAKPAKAEKKDKAVKPVKGEKKADKKDDKKADKKAKDSKKTAAAKKEN